MFLLLAKPRGEFIKLSVGFAIWLFCHIKIKVRWKTCKYNFGYMYALKRRFQADALGKIQFPKSI